MTEEKGKKQTKGISAYEDPSDTPTGRRIFHKLLRRKALSERPFPSSVKKTIWYFEQKENDINMINNNI